MKYSVIIPFKDEEENVEPLIIELEGAMLALQEPFEVLAIDDGSRDATLTVLKRLKVGRPWLKILKFEKNFGQSSAFDAGFKAAKGEFVLTLDGDGQNDPADIEKLIQHLGDADLVCGWRKARKDPASKKIISRIANYIRSRLCEDGVHDTGCSLKLYRRSSLNRIKLFCGMHRFLPALFLIEGFKVKEVPVNHRERTRGKTKYHLFNRSLNTLVDLWAVRWMKKRQLAWKVEEEL
jgi:glycosyltransferase involved in cell wall biosynthesis